MKVEKKDMLLYAVTDRAWLNGRKLADDVKEALEGGVTFLQLREKELGEEEFLKEAVELKQLAEEYRIPFVINDNVEIAKACDADGVHVGQDDACVEEVRKVLGKDKIIGVSVHTVEEAKLAEEQGADYIGVGAVFPTSTKLDVDNMPKETLRAISESVDLPIVAIGGINMDTVAGLQGTGVHGVAVVSAIFAKEDKKEAAKQLREEAKKL